MGNNSYKYITSATTTTFSGNELTKTVLHGIFINKTTAGAITIKQDSTIIGVIAAGTAAGVYWHTERGLVINNLSIVNADAENITVVYTNI